MSEHNCEAVIGQFVWGYQECHEPAARRLRTPDGERFWTCTEHDPERQPAASR
jgi:hypothetical protein